MSVLKWVGIALLAFFVLIGGVIGLAFYFTAAPVKVVEQQLNDIKQGNIEGAYTLFSINAKEAYSFEKFQEFLQAYPSLLRHDTLKVSSRSISGDQASVEGSSVAIDGSVTPIRYSLIKENGEWKVLLLKVNAVDGN